MKEDADIQSAAVAMRCRAPDATGDVVLVRVGGAAHDVTGVDQQGGQQEDGADPAARLLNTSKRSPSTNGMKPRV